MFYFKLLIFSFFKVNRQRTKDNSLRTMSEERYIGNNEVIQDSDIYEYDIITSSQDVEAS